MSRNDPVGQRKKPMQQVALIDEDSCIGCTLCIKACPVDAIVGAQTFMHTVIERECIGCALCVPPCPVDCITMTVVTSWWTPRERAQWTRQRHQQRRRRLARHRRKNTEKTQPQRQKLKDLVREKSAARRGLPR